MTNKEAATIVERIRYYMEGGECCEPTEFEAMDMAIESLNRQDIPDINVSDMIYRQMAIDALNKHLRMTDVLVSYPGIISALTEWLNELPSAGPKIIYCRDCKYKMLDTSGDEWICSHPSNNAWRITADHYCGYAEGREE